MNIKKLNLKADKFNKKIKNLSQFKNFYYDNECLEKDIKVKTINVNNFDLIFREKSKQVLLIDVREKEEFSNYSIKGSISVPLSVLKTKINIDFIKQESLVKEVFTICHLGKRSERASRILSEFNIESRSIEVGLEKFKQIKCG